MDRRTFYFKQPVTESELNGAFDAVEHALDNLIKDQLLYGIVSNLAGAQTPVTPDLHVTVSGPGSAYDSTGERIYQPNASDSVSCAQDSNAVSTAVATPGNERWVSVFIKFIRAASDPRVDGNSNTVYFVENESYEYVVVQAAEAPIGTATKPPLDTSMVLLFDVHIVNGQTAILNTDISTLRRQDMFVIAGTPMSIRAGTPYGAISAMLTNLNNHINGAAGEHPASAITTLAETGTRFSLTASDVQTNLAAIQAAIDSRMTNGTDTVLTFASVAALRAATPHVTNGMVGVTGLGVFLWDSASTATDDGLFVIKEAATATGRWKSLYAQVGANNGLAQLDGTGRVAAAAQRNGIIATGFVTPAVTGDPYSGVETDVTGFSTTASVAVGDIMLVDFGAFVVSGATLGTLSLTPTVVDGATTTKPVSAYAQAQASPAVPIMGTITSHFAYTVLNNGTLTMKMRVGTSGGLSVTFETGESYPFNYIRWMQIRP